jgi:hypothetical protein
VRQLHFKGIVVVVHCAKTLLSLPLSFRCCVEVEQSSIVEARTVLTI